jgi:hypothetical protein
MPLPKRIFYLTYEEMTNISKEEMDHFLEDFVYPNNRTHQELSDLLHYYHFDIGRRQDEVQLQELVRKGIFTQEQADYVFEHEEKERERIWREQRVPVIKKRMLLELAIEQQQQQQRENKKKKNNNNNNNKKKKKKEVQD